jgi:hypothetical protein
MVWERRSSSTFYTCILQPYSRPAALYPEENPWHSVRGRVRSRAIVRLEELRQLNNLKTTSGKELTNSGLVI